MKTLISGLFLLMFYVVDLNGQNEFSKWYFGYQAGLDFASSPPTALSNGSLNAAEGCATISDNAGNLLFYTNGVTVYNAMHAVMLNGSGLNGGLSSAQAGNIVKQPGNNNIYFITTVNSPGFASYSIVDMSLASGLGSVTVKNATLYTSTSENQVAVRHCNGRDVWLVSHEYTTNNFRSYLLTNTGINPTPVISSIGGVIGSNPVSLTALGCLKISPDGKKLAMSTATANVSPTATGIWGFHLFDFNAATGVISNSLTLDNTARNAYGVEFSADGTKLYGCTWNSAAANAQLFQWQVCAPSPAAIVASQYSISINNTIFGHLQRAIDGKIYIASNNQPSLSVINNPNASGAAMNFSLNMLSLAPKSSQTGLPNYINPYARSAAPPFTNVVNCNVVSFAPALPTFSSGCSPAPYPPMGYSWDFGEPASGTMNTSNLFNPVHTYSATGTYTVSLIHLNPCANDTLTQTVNIISITPQSSLAVAGPGTICSGETHIYTASGDTTFYWSNGSTTSTVALSPATTSVYSVSNSSTGCAVTKSFTVSVDICTGLNRLTEKAQIKLYPNPFNQSITVETTECLYLTLLDFTGNIVLQTKVPGGQSQINTGHLKAGVYNLRLHNTTDQYQSKFVKVE